MPGRHADYAGTADKCPRGSFYNFPRSTLWRLRIHYGLSYPGPQLADGNQDNSRLSWRAYSFRIRALPNIESVYDIQRTFRSHAPSLRWVSRFRTLAGHD